MHKLCIFGKMSDPRIEWFDIFIGVDFGNGATPQSSEEYIKKLECDDYIEILSVIMQEDYQPYTFTTKVNSHVMYNIRFTGNGYPLFPEQQKDYKLDYHIFMSFGESDIKQVINVDVINIHTFPPSPGRIYDNIFGGFSNQIEMFRVHGDTYNEKGIMECEVELNKGYHLSYEKDLSEFYKGMAPAAGITFTL